MRATILFLCVSLAACRTSSLGACGRDSDCPANSVCGASSVCETAVCPSCASGDVCQHGACVSDNCPPCPSGQICQSGVCVGQACNPPCDSAHTCDASSLTCVPVTTADVTLQP